MRRCRNRKNGIQNNKETGAIGCILSRRFLLLFVFPVPDKDTAKKTVDKYKVGVCFLNGTLEVTGIDLSAEMLARLAQKHGEKSLRLIQGDYFQQELGTGRYSPGTVCAF